MISVEQAAVNALQTFLQTALPDVVVSSDWPNPDEELPEKAITILRIGARQEMKIDPTVVKSEPHLTGDPPTEHPVLRRFTWRVKLVQQSVQLDIWSRYEAVRDDIHARLDEILNSGTLVTLDGIIHPIMGDEFRDGLLLPMGDGHEGHVDFRFDGPDPDDTPTSVQRKEFRSTRRGEAAMALTITKIQPRFAEIILLTTDSAGFSSTVVSNT